MAQGAVECDNDPAGWRVARPPRGWLRPDELPPILSASALALVFAKWWE